MFAYKIKATFIYALERALWMIYLNNISSDVAKRTENMFRASYYWCNRKQIKKKYSFSITSERKKEGFGWSRSMKKN